MDDAEKLKGSVRPKNRNVHGQRAAGASKSRDQPGQKFLRAASPALTIREPAWVGVGKVKFTSKQVRTFQEKKQPLRCADRVKKFV